MSETSVSYFLLLKGWGGEDDNFANRLKRNQATKYDVLSGKFRELYHDRIWGLDSTPQFASNRANIKKDFASGISNAVFSILQRNDTALRGWNITHLLVEAPN